MTVVWRKLLNRLVFGKSRMRRNYFRRYLKFNLLSMFKNDVKRNWWNKKQYSVLKLKQRKIERYGIFNKRIMNKVKFTNSSRNMISFLSPVFIFKHKKIVDCLWLITHPQLWMKK